MCPHAQIRSEVEFGARKIRCLLVHDHVLLRQGLRRLLEDEPDMEVVAEAQSGAEALTKLAEHRPEVVITDARLFACKAEEVERLVAQASEQSRVLFFAQADETDGLQSASCVVERTSAEELADMVREAHRAGQATVAEMPRRTELPRRGLTSRESEVLKLLAEGRTVRSAASVLGLSAKTVDAHKFNLMRKLGVHNKAELVMWAIRKRVVKLPANY